MSGAGGGPAARWQNLGGRALRHVASAIDAQHLIGEARRLRGLGRDRAELATIAELDVQGPFGFAVRSAGQCDARARVLHAPVGGHFRASETVPRQALRPGTIENRLLDRTREEGELQRHA